MQATETGRKWHLPKKRKFVSVPNGSPNGSEVEDESDKEYTPPAQAEKAKTPTGKASVDSSSETESDSVAQGNCSHVRSTAEWCRLPREVWVKIFSDVIKLEGGCLPVLMLLRRVCSVWNEVCLTPSLWRTIALSKRTNSPSRVPQTAVTWLANNTLQYARHLDLSGFTVSKLADIYPLLKRCKELVALTVTLPPSDVLFTHMIPRYQLLPFHNGITQHFPPLRPILLLNMTNLSLALSSSDHHVHLSFKDYFATDMPLFSLDGYVVDWTILVKTCVNLRHLTLVGCRRRNMSTHIWLRIW